MAKVLIEEDAVDIRVSLLERVVLAEKPRKVPLSRIRSVDPHPPLLDMMVHWSDQSGVWLCGVSPYEGHMIPSARNPSHTLAIDLDGEERERIYVEVDDESPEQAAARITRALHGELAASEPPSGESSEDARRNSRAELLRALDVELDESDEDDIRLRDPLMQGSLPPPPRSEPAPAMPRQDDERDLTKLGGWLVATGSVGLVAGGAMLATGALPGLLALAAGGACALLGGVALAVVANHQN